MDHVHVGRDYNDDGDFAQALRWMLIIYAVTGSLGYMAGWWLGCW